MPPSNSYSIPVYSAPARECHFHLIRTLTVSECRSRLFMRAHWTKVGDMHKNAHACVYNVKKIHVQSAVGSRNVCIHKLCQTLLYIQCISDKSTLHIDFEHFVNASSTLCMLPLFPSAALDVFTDNYNSNKYLSYR